MKTRKSKIITSLALTGIIAAGGVWAGTSAYGALGIDTAKTDCSISFSIGDAVSASYQDLSIDQIPITVYKVADVNTNGEYTVDSAYPDLKLSSISSQTTAEEWQEMSLAAFGDLNDGSQGISNGQTGSYASTIGSLTTGMYLVVPGDRNIDTYKDNYQYGIVLTDEHVYEFTPYLVAVPYNNYYNSGDDTWLYDVSSILKYEQSDRYGSLVINKTLDNYNETLNGATFVYDVEATKEVDGAIKTVYSNAVPITFNAAGDNSVTLEHCIPAGSTVTVTEVYSGSAYEAVSDSTQTVEITADETSATEFENKYDQGINYGSAVDNHFENGELSVNGEPYQK